LGLVAVPVDNILWSHWDKLKSVLGNQHASVILFVPQCNLDVYVTKDNCHNYGLLLTLAVDIVLRCPPFFIPTNPAYRQGWTYNTADELQHWF
jgi:hypothetical protein